MVLTFYMDLIFRFFEATTCIYRMFDSLICVEVSYICISLFHHEKPRNHLLTFFLPNAIIINAVWV